MFILTHLSNQRQKNDHMSHIDDLAAGVFQTSQEHIEFGFSLAEVLYTKTASSFVINSYVVHLNLEIIFDMIVVDIYIYSV